MVSHPIPLSAASIVRQLGGASALSRDPELPVKRSAIANWSKEGIPAKWWPALARIAARSEATAHINLEALERYGRDIRDSGQVAA